MQIHKKADNINYVVLILLEIEIKTSVFGNNLQFGTCMSSGMFYKRAVRCTIMRAKFTLIRSFSCNYMIRMTNRS